MHDSPFPTISIVTPCRDAARFLGSTIDCITAQQGDFSLEYVVADGGSTDGTLSVIEARQDRITRVLTAPDRHMYDGIANAFATTSGGIMGWLNADDLYFPWTLSYVASIFRELPEVEWITTLTPTVIDADGDILRMHKIAGVGRDAFLEGVYIGLDDPALPLGTWFIQQESTFWRRSLWDRAGGADVIRNYEVAGDFALWCAFLRCADPVAVEAPLAMWRWHEDQLSSRKRDLYRMEALSALNALRTGSGERTPLPPVAECGYPFQGLYAAKTTPAGMHPRWRVDRRTFHVLPKSRLKSLCLEYRVF